MHPDDKVANHGKQVSGESGSHIQSVNQQAQQQQQQQVVVAGHLGQKSGNGVKSNQTSPGNRGLKSVSQSVSSTGGMLKPKSKRERSVSTDSDTRNVRTSVENDAKGEGIMRSKRRCVLERKQPYSGDEWCSGPDTEEDEEKPQTAIHREKTMLGPVQGLYDSRSSESGSVLKVEPKQTTPQLVYVFTTSLANSAADAVLKGQSDSILLFHQQNVPRPKLEQGHADGKKTPNLLEKLRSSSSPPGCAHKSQSGSQSGTPRPSSAGVVGMTPQNETLPSSAQSDSEVTQTSFSTESHNNNQVSRVGGSCLPDSLVPPSRDGDTLDGILPVSGVSPQSPTAQSLHHQSAQAPRFCPDNLSKEQREHRERSLQTLRDIERLFLRTGANTGHGDPESSCNNPNNPPGITERSNILEGIDIGRTISGGSVNVLSSSQIENLRKYEEPLQSIISQTPHGPQVDHNIDHPHQISSPGMDMGHLLGPEGLTPEQIAWRKLQEEYYQEKRRLQEIQPSAHSQDIRMSEMQMHGGPMMVRGPPPPYHSKPGERQWTNSMVRGNAQMLDMQEGRQGSRFMGQIPRGPSGASFPGGTGVFPLDRAGHQRLVRPGMPWFEEMPNDTGAGGPFQGLFASGTTRHLQGNAERLLAREMFRPVGQCPMLRTLRLSKQQQHSSLMSRLMDNPGGQDFPNLMMGRGPPSSQNDSLDFPGSRDILGSPGAGPQIKDLVDSPLGNNIPLTMNPSMNLQQQQLNLAQKLRRPSEVGTLNEIFGPAISQGRNMQNRHGENINPGPDGRFQFPNQSPFSEEPGEGSYIQADPEMFEDQNTNHSGGTMRLTHIPILRGSDARSRHASDPSLNPLTSPSHPAPHRLKSPSEEPVPSPLMPSPSGASIKSPSKMPSVAQPPLPSTSGAGTPSSASMRSPAVVAASNQGLHSPSASPGQLKSPAVGGATGSPGWTSPKPALPSPVLTSGKTVGNGGPSETDQSRPPRSLSSTPISQLGSTNTRAPFTSSPDVPPSQNPLSLIMSQMSKYAMPSSTPLYHDAIKTLASSDDEMLPDRPLLSGVSIGGNIGNAQASQLLGPEPQSPMGVSPMGVMSQGQQQLSHDTSGPMLSSPNQATLSTMNSVLMGGSTADEMRLCNVSPLSQNQMGGFSHLQPPRLLHSPVGEMSQNFHQSNDNMPPSQQLHMISKGHPNQRHPPPDSMGLLRDGPDLSEVIRPTHTGIPEFDLSRIIPCDKPSSILQYFPKSDSHQNPSQRQLARQPSPQLLKQLSSTYPPHSTGSSSNPHIAHLQNMMAEQQLQNPSHIVGRQGLGVPRGMGPVAGIGSMCPPGQMMGRPAMPLQQQHHGMMPNNSLHHSVNPYQGIMSSQQHTHSTMAQHNMMMMQAKQQGLAIPGDPFGPQGPLLSPQGQMMGLSQPGMMGPQSIRQRGMSLSSPITYGPGSMANMPF